MNRWLAALLLLLVSGCAAPPQAPQEPTPPIPAEPEPAAAPMALQPTAEYQLAPDLRATGWLSNEAGFDGGALRVTDSQGQELLKIEAGVLEVVGTREIGAPRPVLVVMIAGGGSMGMFYEAYRLLADQSTLERLPWNGAPFVISRSGVRQGEQAVTTTYRQELAAPPPPPARSWKERFARWQYQDGVIERVTDGDVSPDLTCAPGPRLRQLSLLFGAADPSYAAKREHLVEVVGLTAEEVAAISRAVGSAYETVARDKAMQLLEEELQAILRDRYLPFNVAVDQLQPC